MREYGAPISSAVFGEDSAPVGGSGGSTGGSGPVFEEPPTEGELSGIDTTSTEFEILVDPPRTRSFYCGDGVVDPLLEECDDGFAEGADGDATSDSASICSPNCQTRDVLAVVPAAVEQVKSRRLGLGRHPLARGGDSVLARRGALVFVEPGDPALAQGTAGSAPRIVARVLDAHGNPIESVLIADAVTPVLGGMPTSTSDPVVAVTSSGTVAVLYDELNGDGSERGVALRTVQWPADEVAVPGAGQVGAARFVNQTTMGAQQSADVVWTGSELIVAWLDTSDAETGPDIRYRVLDAEGDAIESEATLAASRNPEGAVGLTSWTREEGTETRDTWAAAWRESLPAGNEAIVVASEGETIRIEPGLVEGTLTNVDGFPGETGTGGGAPTSIDRFGPGQAHDRPALAPLDDAHVAVAFTVGTDPEETGVASVGRLVLAVVDLVEGDVVSLDFVEPLVGGSPWDPTRSLEQPTLIAATDPADEGLPAGSVFLGWRSMGALGNPGGEDLWLKRLDWEGESLDLELEEVPWVRDPGAPQAHSLGDQRVPALADFAVPGGGAVGMVWEDWGSRLSPDQAKPDVGLQIAPLPVRRGPPVEHECAADSCGIGEGPCETSADCESGLECAERAGPFYGYGPETAVCRPATCDEEDCGGTCGACFECPGPEYEGTGHYCSAVCPCENLLGDCDNDFDCQSALTCAESTGELVGYPEPIDLCLVPHCVNETEDGDEVRTDCGGVDCVGCGNGQPNYCAGADKCNVGEGNCQNNAECTSGLVCGAELGEYYGLASDISVCHEASCPTSRAAPQSADSCSASCKCVAGQGSCSNDAECTTGYCRPRAGLYYGEHVDLAVCQPAYCHNGIEDQVEIDVDCGGECGSECPACDDDVTFRSFEYAIDSTAQPGFRGIERSSGTALAWRSSTTVSSDASQSVEFVGCGTATVVSPWFAPEEFQIVGDELALDLQPRTLDGLPVPVGVTALGSVTMRVQRPYPDGTAVLGTFSFSRGSENQWTKRTAAVSSTLRDLFLAAAEGSTNDEMRFEWTVEISCTAPPLALHLDNLRFGGDAVFRSECGAGPGQGSPGPSTSLFGFEDVAKWSSAQATPTLATTDVRQAAHAMVMPSGNHQLVSVPFSPAGLGADRKLLVDVKLPAAPSGGSLSGSIQASLSCPSVGLVGVSLGSHSIAPLPRSTWLALPYSLTADQVTKLGAYPRDCRLTIGTTLSGAVAGSSVKYDDLRFAPLGHCSNYVQIDEAPFALGMAVTPNGSASYPYRMCAPEQVQSVMNASGLWASTILLEQDIDLAGVSGQVGTSAVPFTGVFNGQLHTLRNFVRHDSTGSSVGLFGWVDPTFVPSETAGAVMNVTIELFDVSGANTVGALVGWNEGFVSGVTANAPAVSGSGPNVGGLIGTNYETVQGVTVNGPVVECGTSNCGGIIGSHSAGTLNGVTAIGGTISGAGAAYGGIAGSLGGTLNGALSSTSVVGSAASSDVGGLVGTSFGSVASSSASGEVIGGVRVGGAVGSAATGSLSGVSASGRVEGLASTSRVGGLVGLVSGISVSDCGATGPVFGRTATGGFAGEVADGASLLRVTSTGAVTHLAGESAGGLVGYLKKTGAQPQPKISLSSASSAVSSSGSKVGGLIGTSQGGRVRSASATGNVSSSGTAVGGLVGQSLDASTIDRTFATGTVTSTSTRAGGLVGEVQGQSVIINSYARGAVSATGDTGALVGRLGGTARVDRSYATGAVSGSGTRGAFVGFQEGTPRLIHSFASSTVNGALQAVGNVAGAAGVTMITSTQFSASLTSSVFRDDGWGILYTWGTGSGGPVLRSDPCLEYAQSSSAPFISGWSFTPSGSSTSPYPICTAQQFNTVRTTTNVLDKHMALLADIDFTGVTLSTSIGGTGQLNGAFLGYGYRFSNVQVPTVSGGTGLFKAVASSVSPTVSDLYVENAQVTGTSTVGILAGTISQGTLTEVHVQGSLGATGSDVGGLVGVHTGGVVEFSSANVVISATGSPSDNVGGLVGRSQGSTARIRDSKTAGSISVTGSYLGGVVGLSSGALEIQRVSSSASVTSVGVKSYVGGVVGSALNGSMIDAAASGLITSGSGNVGGLAGYLENFNVTNCSATGNVGGQTTGVGGLVGRMSGTSEVRHCTSSGSATSVTSSNVGGLVGSASGNVIADCVATGNAQAQVDKVGGLVGWISAAGMTVARSSAHGSATSITGSYAGGLVGDSLGNIHNCYATGSVSAVVSHQGGLVGRQDSAYIRYSYSTGQVATPGANGAFVGTFLNTVECTSCFYKTSSNSGMASHASGSPSPAPAGRSDAQMTTQSAFTSFDFSAIWIMGASGPVLR